MNGPGPESELRSIRDRLQQESSGIQIRGRALTAAEHARVAAIGRALPLLEQAIEVLEGGDPVAGEATPGASGDAGGGG